jgi:propanol-preferring alcohol dehydrogenase
VVAALAAIAPGATVAVNAIHLDEMPRFDYDLLWKERVLRSVANFTRRDAREFLDIAAEIPIRAHVETFPLERAQDALDRLQAGGIDGSAVLTL